MEMGPWLKVSSYRLLKPVIEIYDPWFTRRAVYPLHQNNPSNKVLTSDRRKGPRTVLMKGCQ